MTIRDHMHLMPRTVLDVAEVLRCCQSVAAGGVDEIGVVIDNVIGVRGVVVSVELNADTVLDPRHTHAAARAAERLVAERVIVQHEAHAVGAIVVVADVNVEGDVEGLLRSTRVPDITLPCWPAKSGVTCTRAPRY